MLTNQAKKQIMETLLRVIHHISDKEYQKRVWIKAEGPEVDDFDETCDYYFGEIYAILGNYQDFKITDKQYDYLKKFTDKFREFSDGYLWPPFFIDTPEWAEIMQEAKEVLKAFHYEKSDE